MQWTDNVISLNVSFGGNMLHQKGATLNTRTNRLLKPNLFVITNTSQILSGQSGSEKRVNSLYGMATIGFRNWLFLDITGRNDWSSRSNLDNYRYDEYWCLMVILCKSAGKLC